MVALRGKSKTTYIMYVNIYIKTKSTFNKNTAKLKKQEHLQQTTFQNLLIKLKTQK